MTAVGLLFVRTRLIVPLGLGVVGVGIAIAVGLTTPHPEFTTLGTQVLVVGSPFVGAYAEGWYVWLLAYGLGGLCEYVVRTSVDERAGSQVLGDWPIQFAQHQRVLFGGGVGLTHVIVFITLGLEHGELLSGWLLGWGLFGVFLLGVMSALFLVRYQLIAPLGGFVIILLMTGVEALTMIRSTLT